MTGSNLVDQICKFSYFLDGLIMIDRQDMLVNYSSGSA